ncbi:hypothetical protein UP00_02030 [Enterobacter asburiae]|uniref:hypothetical protein n=1 Tax=Enterobacter cloacae complex TaxID=354276 RepID=UPI0005E7E057|nr:hypothetical protein [Enterobacter asburiae]KJI67649.1 hypothetical protein UP00_02030 [Enterobacter asburiae]HCT3357696.1 hypothetical protein [Enterobacter cloacae]HCT6648643.1 hypothetical protein [Enterobacter cloacae]
MVIGHCIKCLNCDAQFRLRVGVGFDKYQKHYMDCFECFTPIVFSVRADPPRAWIEAEENCALVEHSECLVVNFHPNCAFDKNEIHQKLIFPSIELTGLIFPHMRKPANERILSASHLFDIPNAPSKWGQLKLIARLISDNNIKKAQKTAESYMRARQSEINIYEENTYYPFTALVYEFMDWLFYPRINDITSPIIEELNKLKETGALDGFYSFYKEKLRKENQQRYINIMSDYLARRDHFGQLLYYARIYHDNIDDKIISSKNFDIIRSFYGDAYETLTSNMTIIACINNILDGRPFDEFKSMTLNKYIHDVNKEKKTGPFQNNPLFSSFCEDDLESTIRNGSHHASIWHEGENIIYRSGGTGAQREISYTKYIHLCNKLTIKIAALWVIELHLQYLFEKKNEEYPWFKI